jgi:hypothetical protein
MTVFDGSVLNGRHQNATWTEIMLILMSIEENKNDIALYTALVQI